jgi:hypothetical protein
MTSDSIWNRRMTRFLALPGAFTAIVTLAIAFGLTNASGAPSAEVAKRCQRYSYLVYPFKRPGAVPMSGSRQAYFKDCLDKNGDVPAPTPPKQ